MSRSIDLSVSVATLSEVPIIAALRTSVAEEITRRHGRGHWSSCATEKSVLRAIKTSRLLVVRRGTEIVGTVRLEAKKPWAIDVAYFSSVSKAVYLHDLAVATHAQGCGIGRFLVEAAATVARAWPSNAIRLDAYDHPAGAASFYVKCGFRQVGRVSYRGLPLIYLERLL
jgi:GNAT superfamily N-acetyltransferase